MIRISALLLVVALFFVVKMYPFGELSGIQGETIGALGLVVLGGYLIGEILAMLTMPRVSGYIVAGLLFGPDVLGLISVSDVQSLRLIDSIALSVIALTAGGELHWDSLRKRAGDLLAITAFQTLISVTLGTVSFIVILWITGLDFLNDQSFATWVIAGMIFGAIVVSQAPAIVMAIIADTRSKGTSTELILGVSVLIDIVVIILFTTLMTLARITSEGGGFELEPFLLLANKIFGSALAGIGAGMLLSMYLKHVKREPVLVLLAFSYLVYVGGKTLYFDPLIICVTAGVWVTNASKRGHELIEMIEGGSLIVYVIFFCVAGAGLDLDALQLMGGTALLLFLARLVLMGASTWAAVTWMNTPIRSPNTFWLGFLPQAGVSLGLVAILNKEGFSWGYEFSTLLIALIALNQLLGPFGMKYALQQAGDTADARGRQSDETESAEPERT